MSTEQLNQPFEHEVFPNFSDSQNADVHEPSDRNVEHLPDTSNSNLHNLNNTITNLEKSMNSN